MKFRSIPYTKPPFLYKANYNFRFNPLGSHPTDWTVTEDANTLIEIIQSYKGHLKVIKLEDNSSSGSCTLYNHFGNYGTGTIELWGLTTYSGSNIGGQIGLYVDTTYKFLIGFQDDYIQYWNGSWHEIMPYNINQWYHFRLFTDCGNSDPYLHVWIDSDKKGDYLYYNGTPDYLNRLYLSSGSTPSLSISYFDAIDYSWRNKGAYNRNLTIENFLITPYFLKNMFGKIEGWS